MKKRILVVVLCLACAASYAQVKKGKRTTRPKKPATTQQKVASQQNAVQSQVPPPPVDTTRKTPMKPFERPLDGYYKKNNMLNAKAVPYANLRENDVAFAKRIWREIDVREKMNQYLASPKRRLIDVLLEAIDNGELTAYDPTPGKKDDPDGDGFLTPLTKDKAHGRLAGDSSVVEKRDKDNNVVSSSLVAAEFNPDSVVKFRIKEDWVFDRQRSVFEPRIIGIAPLIKPKGIGNLADVDYVPAFWIYFPEARPILATKEVVSRNSDATGLSFDDAFLKRIFTSYIVKQSNDKNDRIKDLAQGIDRLYEAEKVKKSLMDWELNLWQY
jgi:gliding motility associated protien GldN